MSTLDEVFDCVNPSIELRLLPRDTESSETCERELAERKPSAVIEAIFKCWEKPEEEYRRPIGAAVFAPSVPFYCRTIQQISSAAMNNKLEWLTL